MEISKLDIEKRVQISLSVGRYLRDSERFNEASKAYSDSCKNMRKAVGSNARIVVQINHAYYLLTSDSEGNFDVSPIDCL